MRLAIITAAWLQTGARAQSLTIDWSQVEVDASGTATFGPRVDVPDELAPPHVQNMTGWFANADDFYGRPGFVEYQYVRVGEGERLEAVRVVGDHNVPRNKLTWRTARGVAAAPTWRMPIQLQLRDDKHDDRAYWWSPGHVHEVEWSPGYDFYTLIGQSPRSSLRAHFHRVTQDEALHAARTVYDAP